MQVRRIVVAAAIGLILPLSAAAQDSVGVRVGVSADPDQFLFGGHLETAPLLERLVFQTECRDRHWERPRRDRAELRVRVRDRRGRSGVVSLCRGGPSHQHHRPQQQWPRRRGGDDTDVEGGFNILIGVEHEGGLFTELKVGALDSPDLKFIVGYVF